MSNSNALAVTITAVIVVLLPFITSWWVRGRASQLRPEDVASQSFDHRPSKRAFAVAFYIYAIGFLPVVIFFASPNRDIWIAAFFFAFTIFVWALATYRFWMLCHTRLSIRADVILYETERGKTIVPKDAVRRVFVSAGHIVIEKTDTTRVAIPMMFAHNAVLYAQLTELTRQSKGSRG